MMNRKLKLQALAFGLITIPSFALYWVDPVGLFWCMMVLIATGMVIGLRVS
jgi:hypothetical protein